jgi:hypothetical protein
LLVAGKFLQVLARFFAQRVQLAASGWRGFTQLINLLADLLVIYGHNLTPVKSYKPAIVY